MEDLPLIEADSSDEAYAALLEKLDREFPTLAKTGGLDLSQIKGSIRRRSGKAVVLHLVLCGWTVSQIAEAVGVSPTSVSNTLADALAEAAPIDDIELLRQLEIERLAMIEQAANREFARSCENAVRVMEKEAAVNEEVESVAGERTTTTEGQSGNPAYLRILLDASKRRSAMLGLDKPTKIEKTTDVREMKIVEVVVRTREDAVAMKEAGLLK